MSDSVAAGHRAVTAARQAVRLSPGETLTLEDATLTLARALRTTLDIPGAIAAYQQLPAELLRTSVAAELAEAEAQLPRHRRRLKRCPQRAQTWEERLLRVINGAKRIRRPHWTLEQWSYQQFAALDLSKIFQSVRGNISRTGNASPSTPAVLCGAMADWPAMKLWTLPAFAEDFGHQKIICDHRFGIRLRMNDFIDYLKKQEDDSPLYLFDHCFGEYPSTRALLKHYSVPPVFGQDLLELLGPLRPPYRWLLIGPRRSGSTLHKDPLGTSAWNALISGRKLWVLFPPGTPAEKLRPEVAADSAAAWFLLWWRRKREEWPLEAIEFIQEPGEIVFVPARWWHAVLNLEDTIAVTQNFCNEWNAAAVWRCAKATHPILARQLCSIFDSEGIQLDAHPVEGDDPSQSYLFDLPASEPPEPDKTENPQDSSDDEYLTWLSVKRQKWTCITHTHKPYSGHLVNNGVTWGITDTILKWDGLGPPPPELSLRPPGPPEPKPEEQQRRKKFAEQAEEHGKEKMSLYGSSALDKVKSRADILATLGFDDQHIYGVDGLVRWFWVWAVAGFGVWGRYFHPLRRGWNEDFEANPVIPFWLSGGRRCATAQLTRSETGAMDETVLVTLARVAERAERYDEMADFMKQRVQVGSALNPEERDMFSAAFKNSLTERRHAVRVAAGVEQMELSEGREAYASLAGGYRSKMEA
ncbi:unnamed protein product, partial [Cladocopium goreaui]